MTLFYNIDKMVLEEHEFLPDRAPCNCALFAISEGTLYPLRTLGVAIRVIMSNPQSGAAVK